MNGPQNVVHFYIVGKLACEVPEHDFDDDDINIMMKCLSVCVSVTKNDHFLLGVSCNHLQPPITTMYNSRLVFLVFQLQIGFSWSHVGFCGFFKVTGWFFMVPGPFFFIVFQGSKVGFSWFQVVFLWFSRFPVDFLLFQVGFHGFF